MDATGVEQRIASDLRRLGLVEGGLVMVHSSLSALGHVPGGPETVVRALLQAVGAEGTLLMPALSYRHVGPNQPTFDVRHTPSNVGAIPEHFRTRPGTVRSIHPTHSVCGVGPLVDRLFARHDQDRTPCGANSPFRRLPDFDGRILMLGCGLRPNTSMHAVEETVSAPYLLNGHIQFQIIDHAGRARWVRHRVHSFAGIEQRYDRLADVLSPPDLVGGFVLEATAHLIDTRAMWPAVREQLQRDAWYFVDRIGAQTG